VKKQIDDIGRNFMRRIKYPSLPLVTIWIYSVYVSGSYRRKEWHVTTASLKIPGGMLLSVSETPHILI